MRAEKRVVVLSVLGVLAGGVLSFVGTAELIGEHDLESKGTTVQARVTDARIMQGSGESFELRYAFTVAGRTETFTGEDELGRTNLWATIDDRTQWQAALDTQSIAVLYLPRNPRVNRVIRRHGAPVGDSATVLLFGLVLGALFLRVGWLEVSGRGDLWRDVLKRIGDVATARR
jgi:hypothetical protein